MDLKRCHFAGSGDTSVDSSPMPEPVDSSPQADGLKKVPDLEALPYFAPGILGLTTRVRTFGGHHRGLSHGHAQMVPAASCPEVRTSRLS